MANERQVSENTPFSKEWNDSRLLRDSHRESIFRSRRSCETFESFAKVMKEPGNKEFNHEKSEGVEQEAEDGDSKVARRREEMKGRQSELMKRGESKDFLRRLFIERNEAEQEETLLRAQEAQELRCLQAEQTQKLGEELMRRKHDDIRQQKLRQLLRSDSIELRQLENQLREAYAAKAARTQLLEREIYRRNSKIQELEQDRMIQGWYRDDRFEKEQMLEAHRKKEQYRRDLQEQLVSNQRLRQQKIEETRLEGKLVEDTLTRGIESHENRREKRAKASRLQDEQRAFLEARESRKSREKQAALREEKEYARMFSEKLNQEKQGDDAKAALRSAKEAMVEKMTQNILNAERVKREREDAIEELMTEEEKNELENRLRNAAIEKARITKESLEDMERQRIMKEESKSTQTEIDRAFAKYLEKEREKLIIADRRKQEERRAKGIEYGKDLKEAIASSGMRYAEEILRNQAGLRKARIVEDERRQSIEKECSRMLSEHEKHLQGFLKFVVE